MPVTLKYEQVLQRVCQMAAEQVGADPAGVTPETHLFNDLGFDSLDAVEFTMRIEDEFEVNIPDERGENVRTVGQAILLLIAIQGT